MNLTLKIWRQKDANSTGRLVTYQAKGIDPEMGFLDVLDLVNEGLEAMGKEPVAFDGECREGTCGSCGCMVNGKANGPHLDTGNAPRTLCMQTMRDFKDGDTILIEPFRARAFPVLKDLVVDRSALDRIIQAGGSIGVQTGHAPDANALPVSMADADRALDAAACIGCGACVAACPNASAALFMSAKVSQFALLPQGEAEKHIRAVKMVDTMDVQGFGGCTNHRECEAACPKAISTDFIALLNRDYLAGSLKSRSAG